MSYCFFFSYAHADQDVYLDTFYKDLAKQVRQLTGAQLVESGFIDRYGIEHGAAWDKRLEDALQTCRVFVPIYSPSYFLSPYCGKELKVFRDRVTAYAAAKSTTLPPPLIFPVLWSSEDTILPKVPKTIANIQYKHGSYPQEYLDEGVYQLVLRGVNANAQFYNQYWALISSLAKNIVKAAEAHELPPLAGLQPLDTVPSLFSTSSRAPAASSDGGPRYVQFIFVAAQRGELTALRTELKFYGQSGGSDWQPFLDLHYEEVVLSPNIVQQIRAAATDNKIVVVVADTWTLRLTKYHDLIAPLDQHQAVNCITLIVWNDEDQEAAIHRSSLEATVKGTFGTKISLSDPHFLSGSVKSYGAFKSELIRAIVNAQAKVVETAKVQKNLSFVLQKAPATAFDTKPSL
jgi:hypothetical protein